MMYAIMPRSSIRKAVLLAQLVALTLSACGTYHPLDIPDEQWQVMNTDQRLQAQHKQAELDQIAAERQVAEARAREAEAAQKAAQLEIRRQQARYGERLQCVISASEARLGGKWRGTESVALDVVQGLEAEFTIAEPANKTWRYRTSGYAYFDGQTLALCRNSAQQAGNLCARVLGTFEDFRRGVNQPVEVPGFLRGHLHCNLAPGSGMPQRLIIER